MKANLRGPVLSRAIRDYIKQYIIDNHLKPGDRLPPEGEFARELGVGRSSVREAVKALQSLGIIEVQHGNGLYVREWNFEPVLETLKYGFEFDTYSLQELFKIRIWLESAVIGDAVRKISDHEISELKQVLDRWEERVRNKESDSDLDKEFHFVLYGVLNNKTLLKLFEVFWIAFDMIQNQTIKHSDQARAIKEHRLLYEAVKERDSALARERLIQHFAEFQERLEKNYSNSSANAQKVLQGQ